MDRTAPTQTSTPTPTQTLSAADVDAHRAASYVRPAATDSDPDADELLRRARTPRTISSIPRRQVRTAIADQVRGW